MKRPCRHWDLCLAAAVWLDTPDQWAAGIDRAARVAYFAELERAATGVDAWITTQQAPDVGGAGDVMVVADASHSRHAGRAPTEVTERLTSKDLGRWLAQVQQVGHCASPIRLVGSSDTLNTATGEVLRSYTSASEPDGITYLRCGNRRRAVCRVLLTSVPGRRVPSDHGRRGGRHEGRAGRDRDAPAGVRHADRAFVRAGACGEEARPARHPAVPTPQRHQTHSSARTGGRCGA